MPECDSDAARQRTLQVSRGLMLETTGKSTENQPHALPPVYLQFILKKKKKKSLALTPHPLRKKQPFIINVCAIQAKKGFSYLFK